MGANDPSPPPKNSFLKTIFVVELAGVAFKNVGYRFLFRSQSSLCFGVLLCSFHLPAHHTTPFLFFVFFRGTEVRSFGTRIRHFTHTISSLF
mmetsp:Transcript_34276/g.34453  ORF Transcript_34276/g.34453 Transcript_34276/m.34453 type:complete len:92 (+) Transcript_34276:339-614(+)